MLTELSIENFALVEKQRMLFGPGLNILTGETGAGKSILLGALGMVLGDRVSADVIRHGAEKARVEAIFTVEESDTRLLEALEGAGIETEEGVLLLGREINPAGKGSVRVNGRPATLGILKSIGDALVDIHGQHEHQSLLAVERHLDILDSWCSGDILELKEQVAVSYSKAQTVARELAALQQDARERVRTIDLLQFQRDEIDHANPKAGEEEELTAERLRLASAEKLFSGASSAYNSLSGGELGGGAQDSLTKAVAAIEGTVRMDEHLNPVLEALQNALYAVEEVARDVRDYRDRIEFNPERLEEVELRLGVLKTLTRKYGEDIETVIRYRAEIGVRLDTLENAESRIAELTVQSEAAHAELEAHAARLTAARQQAALPFAEAIQRELADLAMTAARFSVSITPQSVGAKGADHVEFLIAPNPGEPLKPLAKTASGGEISRVMLAMKSILARTLSVPTLVFDEIDTGIGGRTSIVLADKLAALSHLAQILCITHLPQIAARGGTHFAIEKHTEGGRTIVGVTTLSSEERVHEIARMLGGTRLTDTVLQHAREMLTPSK